MVQRVDRTGDEVAGQGQLDHPTHPEIHPAGAEEVAEQEPLAARRCGAEGDLEEHHADDGERPETPRRHRQRDERPGAERERRTRQTADQARCGDVVACVGFDGRRGHGRPHGNGAVDHAAVSRRLDEGLDGGLDERQLHDDALPCGSRRMAGEQRGRGRVGRVDDPQRVGADDLGPDDRVVEHAVGSGERDDVAGHEPIEAAELGVVARAVTGDHGVADLAGRGRAGPVARPVVERGQPDPFVHRRVEADARGSRSTRPGRVVPRRSDPAAERSGW